MNAPPLTERSVIVASMTLRIDDADGGVHALTHLPDGTIEMTDLPPGPGATGIVSRIGADGQVRLAGRDPTGTEVDVPEPIEFDRRTNLFGTVVEWGRYPGGLQVERTFDDESRLARVHLRGAWGDATVEIRTDGSSSLAWESARVHGHRRWSAGRSAVAGEARSM